MIERFKDEDGRQGIRNISDYPVVVFFVVDGEIADLWINNGEEELIPGIECTSIYEILRVTTLEEHDHYRRRQRQWWVAEELAYELGKELDR